MQVSSLEQRRARIRLPMVDLAALARVDKYTAKRCLSGEKDTRSSKAAAIASALVEEELSLLIHLARLHPQAALENAEAARHSPRPRAA
ncbi:hypothetical protein [Bosea minatitlanensis]|uniref:Uncharacterized protein n=1 Tax=Bosea minatitlanensis TaxID=128782 RepID=A0ABW0EZ25_9HYPH|nr:hypothetical protein [Bosea minatitlanensis]MCT4496043.1 hypothetical protein [Bosea minatitlanensis]